MSPLDRLIKTRQQERDEASSAVSSARKRLEELETAERELIEDAQQRIAAGAESDNLTAATLEQLDLAGRFAQRATEAGEQAMETAREQAIEVHRSLRLLEILRERVKERERTAQRSRERRELDEVAARKSARKKDVFKAGSLLVVVFALFPAQGCHTEAAAEEPAAAAATSPASPAKAKGEQARCPEEIFSEEELILLRKLRKRHETLAEREKELNLKEARVLAAESRVVVLMEQLRMLQGSLNGEKRPVAAAQPKTKEEAEETAPVDLVGVLKGMNRRAASAMLAQMDPRMVASAMVKLSPPEVAKLLAMMPPENAALVGAHLAVKRRPKRRAPEPTPAAAPATPTAKAPAAAPPMKTPKKERVKRTPTERKGGARKEGAQPRRAPSASRRKKDWTPVKPPAPRGGKGRSPAARGAERPKTLAGAGRATPKAVTPKVATPKVAAPKVAAPKVAAPKKDEKKAVKTKPPAPRKKSGATKGK